MRWGRCRLTCRNLRRHCTPEFFQLVGGNREVQDVLRAQDMIQQVETVQGALGRLNIKGNEVRFLGDRRYPLTKKSVTGGNQRSQGDPQVMPRDAAAQDLPPQGGGSKGRSRQFCRAHDMLKFKNLLHLAGKPWILITHHDR